MDGFIKFLVFILALMFIGAWGLVMYYALYPPSIEKTKLTNKERISMCNARGGIMSDGVCQRVHINLCHRRL